MRVRVIIHLPPTGQTDRSCLIPRVASNEYKDEGRPTRTIKKGGRGNPALYILQGPETKIVNVVLCTARKETFHPSFIIFGSHISRAYQLCAIIVDRDATDWNLQAPMYLSSVWIPSAHWQTLLQFVECYIKLQRRPG